MKPRKVFAAIVGTIQGGLGVFAVILTCVLYIDFLGVRTTLNVTEELLPFYLLIFAVFGFFSIMSGLFLVFEEG